MRAKYLLPAILVFGAVASGLVMPWPRPALTPREASSTRTAMPATATAWGLQLQNVVALSIPASVDMLVIDYSRDGTDRQVWTPDRIAALRRRAGGKDRIVLCYLSVGEAESYRFYWKKRWASAPPTWLGPENKDWKSNYFVRYWHRDWQRVLVDPDPSVLTRVVEWLDPDTKPYIDRILDAGFDGVYLDRVDAFGDWEAERGEQAEADMVTLVGSIAGHARRRKPGFLVVPQNGEELVRHPRYAAVIDAIAKEDLLYGIGGEEVPNPADTVAESARHLDSVRQSGKPVFVVEYLQDIAKRAEALRILRQRGYIPLFATRALSEPPTPGEAPATDTGSAPPATSPPPIDRGGQQ